MTSISTYSTRSRPGPHPLASNPEWVHERFLRALEMVQSLPKSGPIQTNYDDKLLLYSVYKQATDGDIKTSRPGLLDVLGRAKWDAWNKRKGLSAMEAERQYVEALIRILKGYSDRTPAVELLRELETFSLDPHGARVAGHGSVAPSRDYSSHSSDSSSTASYENMPPPPLPSSSRHLHPTGSAHLSRHERAPPSPAAAPASSVSRGARYRTPAPSFPAPAPSPADVVAPPLPGYGPPRTQPDPVRQSSHHAHQHRRRRRRRESYSSSASDSGSGSYTGSSSGSEEDDTRRYHPAASAGAPASQRSFAQRSQQQSRGPPSLPPHPSQLSALRPPPSPHTRPPPPQHLATSVRSVAGGSEARSFAAPSSVGGQQQVGVAVAYSPGYTSQQHQRAGVAPLTQGNLRTSHTAPTPPPLSASPAAASATPGLDAALTRIQTSLAALHERLSLLESSAPAPSAALTSSPLATLRELLRRLLLLLRLRSAPPPPGSPTRVRAAPPSAAALLLRLAGSLFSAARRIAADVLVLAAVVMLLGRLRGVDVQGAVRSWVVRWALGQRARGRRVEGA
ncbi:hypothetical protein JCM10213_005772 [Rhodosporidiobolus nylandii]